MVSEEKSNALLKEVSSLKSMINQIDDNEDRIILFVQLSKILVLLNQKKESEELLKNLLKHSKKILNGEYRIKILAEISSVYKSLDKFEDAKKTLEEALLIAKEIENERLLDHTLETISKALLDIGAPEDVLKLIDRIRDKKKRIVLLIELFSKVEAERETREKIMRKIEQVLPTLDLYFYTFVSLRYASTLLEMGMKKKALEIIDSIEKMSFLISEAPIQVDVLSSLAAMLKFHNPQKARDLILKAESAARNILSSPERILTLLTVASKSLILDFIPNQLINELYSFAKSFYLYPKKYLSLLETFIEVAGFLSSLEKNKETLDFLFFASEYLVRISDPYSRASLHLLLATKFAKIENISYSITHLREALEDIKRIEEQDLYSLAIREAITAIYQILTIK